MEGGGAGARPPHLPPGHSPTNPRQVHRPCVLGPQLPHPRTRPVWNPRDWWGWRAETQRPGSHPACEHSHRRGPQVVLRGGTETGQGPGLCLELWLWGRGGWTGPLTELLGLML